jgi:MoxR-like ATPase
MSSAFAEIREHGRRELAKTIVGQAEALDLLLITVICGGHALVEGVPGLAKTLAVRTLGRILGLGFQRVQCTPDLMPADIMGTNVLHAASGQFVLHAGPLFTDLLLVDEINRMPPRTQAALLESMEERQVTIDRVSHPLSPWFTVFATQNPIEFEGTYPLPEAQLDRFLVKIRVSYPDEVERQEEAILERYHRGFDARELDRLDLTPVSPGQLAAAREEVRSVRVEPPLFRYIADLMRRTRDWPVVSLGASPRAGVNLLHVAKALAASEGRDYLLPDDVKLALPAVLRHRIVLKPEADLEGLTTDRVLVDVMGAVEVPA